MSLYLDNSFLLGAFVAPGHQLELSLGRGSASNLVDEVMIASVMLNVDPSDFPPICHDRYVWAHRSGLGGLESGPMLGQYPSGGQKWSLATRC